MFEEQMNGLTLVQFVTDLINWGDVLYAFGPSWAIDPYRGPHYIYIFSAYFAFSYSVVALSRNSPYVWHENVTLNG
jgi:hypothetical protein